MNKEKSQTQIRKEFLILFCNKFTKYFYSSPSLSIADLEVKAIKGLEKYMNGKPVSELPLLKKYLKDFSLAAQTLNELLRAGYEDIVRLSYEHHGQFYNTEHHVVVNEKLKRLA